MEEARGAMGMVSGRFLRNRLLRRWWRPRAGRDHVVYRGSVLPSAQLRDEVGAEFASDDFFLDSALSEARRVVARLGCASTTTLVDVGCGFGRLAIGLLREVGELRYWGFDVVAQRIEWCRKHIGRRHPSFQFVHLDVVNERYNPTGRPLTPGFRLPLADGGTDIVYLWGLFTNMAPEHMRIYVAETSRSLKRGGRAFLTAFTEKDVPAVELNPQGYVDYDCTGPLHVVRYEESFLFSTFAEHGLRVDDYGRAGGKQSEIYLRKS